MQIPEGIPQKLLDEAACVVIIPRVKQAAFVISGKYGKGFAICRYNRGRWTAPAGVILTGGSVGFQIGANNTDVVMLVMDATGMRRLLQSPHENPTRPIETHIQHGVTGNADRSTENNNADPSTTTDKKN